MHSKDFLEKVNFLHSHLGMFLPLPKLNNVALIIQGIDFAMDAPLKGFDQYISAKYDLEDEPFWWGELFQMVADQRSISNEEAIHLLFDDIEKFIKKQMD